MAGQLQTHRLNWAYRLLQTNSDANSWDARYASQELVWSLEPNQFVVQHLAELAVGQMVDLAGGEGRNALWFASKGWLVENVEISGVALEKFQLRAVKDGLETRVFSNHSSAADAKFTLSPSLLVVAYLQLESKDLFESLDNAVTQLEPGATVFGIWHAKRNLSDGFGGPPDPALLPSSAELEAWARAVLDSFEVFEVERKLVHEGQERVAIDVVLKGRIAKTE